MERTKYRLSTSWHASPQPVGNAVWLFPEYMEGRAKSVVQRMIGAPANAESAGTSQLTTYISVVSRLINRYATDDALQALHVELTAMRQKSNESCIAFQERITDRAKAVANAYTISAMVNLFVQGVHDYLRGDLRQRWTDLISEVSRKPTEDAFQYYERECIMFDKLAHYAESQRIDKVAASEYSENSSTEGKNNQRKKNRSGNVMAVKQEQQEQVSTLTTTSTSNSSLPSWQHQQNDQYNNNRYNNNNNNNFNSQRNNGNRPQYNNNYGNYNRTPNTGYNNYSNNQGNWNKGGSSQQNLNLPFGVYFKIPRGWTDITRPVKEIINPGKSCRICSCYKDTPNGHETSECPLLPNSIHDRYRLLAGRLENIFKFRNGVQDGLYEPTNMPESTANPVNPAPQILKKNSGADHSQKRGE